MRLKNLFLLPSVIAGLTTISTGCYGGSANDTNAGGLNNDRSWSDTSTGSNRVAPAPSGKGTIPTTSNTYSSSTYSSTSTITPKTTTPNDLKRPTPTTSTLYATGGNSCSTTDLAVFEEADEEGVYGDHGFTRGDMKNLFVTKYDVKSDQTINGNVLKILRVQYTDGNCYFIAVVQIDSGLILVNLGPVWFADENNIVINEGDTVQISGSLIRTNGRYILIARQLKKDGQTLQLRNQAGNAQWGSPKSQRGTNGY